ncbi:hypothetical protein EUX98_g8461 [Antrodiella citrinella]|uniref:Chromo domain-containing protein n=1 Tax=Antrodiella citrinella TaxID=2447956 RepID=A0A4S4M7I3_9APHY|nr:hypothetical protein EUX98_g8461 [Antrodiella citrinella]
MVNLHDLHEYLRDTISAAQERYKETADNVRKTAPPLSVGDKVFVHAKFLNTPHSPSAFPLTSAARIRYSMSRHSSPERVEPPPLPVEVDGEIQHEIKAILDSKLDRRYRVKLCYWVEWLGYEGTDKQYTWVGANDIQEYAPEAIQQFHLWYPNKPGPDY